MADIGFADFRGHSADTRVVQSDQDLQQALGEFSASGGGTILLDASGGPYTIEASGIGGVGSEILITSADPGAPAILQQVNLRDSAFISFDTVTFDHSGLGAARSEHHVDLNISASSHISVTNSYFMGSANGFATYEESSVHGGRAAQFRDSEFITFDGNTVANYFHGVAFLDSSDISFDRNELFGMQGDGLRGGGVERAQVTNNHFHDFAGAIQTITHTDMIQFWGQNAKTENRDIVIDSNVLDSGDGAATQGIFIRNETFGNGGPASGHFENISITNNLIYNGAPNGITFNNTRNAVVQNNTVLWNQDAGTVKDIHSDIRSLGPRITAVETIDADVSGNIATRVTVNETQRNGENIALDYDDAGSPHYAYAHIVNLHQGAAAELRDLRLNPDSALFGEYGSSFSSQGDVAIALEAAISSQSVPGARGYVELSAAGSYAAGVAIGPDEAEFIWTLPDGTRLSGQTVRVALGVDGMQTVSLEIRHDSGASDIVTRPVLTRSETLVDLSFAQEAKSSISGFAGLALGDAEPGLGLVLDGSNRLVLDREDFDIFGLDRFELDLDFRLDGTGGSVLRLPGAMNLFAYDNGSFKFRLSTDAGAFELRAPSGTLSDGAFHQISIRFDSLKGDLALYIDGALVDREDARGSTSSAPTSDLILGYAFGSGAEGVIGSLTLTSPPSELVAPLTMPRANMPEPHAETGHDEPPPEEQPVAVEPESEIFLPPDRDYPPVDMVEPIVLEPQNPNQDAEPDSAGNADPAKKVFSIYSSWSDAAESIQHQDAQPVEALSKPAIYSEPPLALSADGDQPGVISDTIKAMKLSNVEDSAARLLNQLKSAQSQSDPAGDGQGSGFKEAVSDFEKGGQPVQIGSATLRDWSELRDEFREVLQKISAFSATSDPDMAQNTAASLETESSDSGLL